MQNKHLLSLACSGMLFIYEIKKKLSQLGNSWVEFFTAIKRNIPLSIVCNLLGFSSFNSSFGFFLLHNLKNKTDKYDSILCIGHVISGPK